MPTKRKHMSPTDDSVKRSPRVLFIGLDSADPYLLQRWANEGVLPTFKHLANSSLWGEVKTPPGLSHAAMWVSLYTGTNPGKHGRSYPQRIKPGSYDLQPFDIDSDLHVNPLWGTLSKANRRVSVIDMVKAPLTEGLNGVQLVDWTTSGVKATTRSWPPNLALDVIARFGTDPLGKTSDADGRGSEDYVWFRDQLIPRVRMKSELCRYLLAQEPWDLFMTVFADPHDVGHQCWHLHAASHSDHDAQWTRQYGDPVRDVYIAVDTAIAELIQQVGQDTSVMIFAGPGMRSLVTGNHLLDPVLRRLECGAAAKPSVTRAGTNNGKGKTSRSVATATLKAMYQRLIPSFVRKLVDTVRGARVASRNARGRSTRKFFVIPSNTDCGAIRINLAGREPSGVVRPSEYDHVCAQLTADLLQLVNVETGERVVENVFRTSDVYHGIHVDELADLMIQWRCSAPIAAVRSAKIGVVEGRFSGSRTGDHAPRGVFYLQSSNIHPGQLSTPVPVEAIAPTIASLLGVDLPGADSGPIVTSPQAPKHCLQT